MNRGSDLDDARDPGTLRASMRPRFMNRGSLGAPSRRDIACSRFNEAPIHESGKSLCHADATQQRAALQ